MKTNRTMIRSAVIALAVAGFSAIVDAQSYPRTLAATADVTGPSGGTLTGALTIYVERLMYDRDFKKAADALRFGGYPNFLPVLRQLPEVGYVQVGDKKTVLKYARERAGNEPRLVLGTDRPVFFVGAGGPEEKPKAGYELSIIELDLDPQGSGHGTMAGAARVRPAPDGSVIIDDYATKPIRLIVKTVQ